MSDIVIKVDNLSKKYIIGHQKQERYTALRDVMANSAKSLGRKLLSPFTHNASRITDSEEFYALRDVSFEIKQGDRVGIIGRNGAGKSTLLKILSRITEPTGGRIELTGRVASLLEVGTGFHPELTGRENIFLNGAILGMSKWEIKKKFDEIVAFAEIEKFLDTPVKRYSSGMYVRLAFAVAAHLEPEILIVDEVLAVGDAQFQKKCLGKMEEVGKEGRTILFVSHNMSIVRNLCSNVILLHKGLVVAKGNSDAVTNQYLADNTIEKTSVEWPNGISNSGVDELKLLSVKLLSHTGEAVNAFVVEKNFIIEITYTIVRLLPFLRVGIIVSTPEGYTILEAYDTDIKEAPEQRKVGRYRTVCTMPARSLNAGKFMISINIGMPNIKNLVFMENALIFSIEEERKQGAFLSTQRRGVMYPNLIWQNSPLYAESE